MLKYIQPGSVAAIAALPTFNPKDLAFQRPLPRNYTASTAALEKNSQWLFMAGSTRCDLFRKAVVSNSNGFITGRYRAIRPIVTIGQKPSLAVVSIFSG